MQAATNFLLAIGVACALVPGNASAQNPAPVVPVVALEDQFERPQDVTALRGQVVVLIYGDRKSADANKLLGEQLHVHFHPTAKGLPPAQARQQPVKPVEGAPAGSAAPEVQAIPIACIGKVPTVVRKILRNQIRAGSPEVPVWLDFEDRMRTHFPFTPGVPNVAVLDAQGRYRHAVAGVLTAESQARLFATIESLRREALAGK